MTFADELRHAASIEPAGFQGNKAARPRPAAAEVLTLDAGFDRLLTLCRAKKVFTRPFWVAMQPPEGGDEAQLRWYLATTVPVPAKAALWLTDTCAFLFVRTHPRVCRWAFTVALETPIPEATRQAARQALWDVGIREIRASYPRENPHTKRVVAEQRFGFEMTVSGRVLDAVKHLVERP